MEWLGLHIITMRHSPLKIKSSDEIIEIKILNGMAWVAYHNDATFSFKDKIIRKAHWLESATVILTENGWKLEMLHSTRTKNFIND